MLSSLRILITPSSDSPLQCYPVVLLHFDKARYVFNCPETLVRSLGQHRVPYGNIRSTFLASTTAAASGGLPGWLLTLSDVGQRKISLHGPIGLKHRIATARTYVRKGNCEVFANELDPRPPAGAPPLPPPSSTATATGASPSHEHTISNISKDKGKEVAVSSQGSASSSSGGPSASVYSDNFVDVYAVPLLPDGLSLPPIARNQPQGPSNWQDDLQSGLGRTAAEPENGEDDRGGPGSSPDAPASSKRHKAAESAPPTSASVFDLVLDPNFSPSLFLTPGSPHASEWVDAIIKNMFYAHKRAAPPKDGAQAAESTSKIVPAYAWAKRLGAPPVPPSLVSLPAEGAPEAIPPLTPQAVPPLVLSYILQGKEQRGVFDADKATIGHGVSAGFLFSLLTAGKSVDIQRPTAWAEWPEIKRKAYHVYRMKRAHAKLDKPVKTKSQKDAWADAYDFEGEPVEDVTVLPSDVLGPSRPGPVVIMLHVPAPAYINSLHMEDNLRTFAPFFARKHARGGDGPPIVIVHTGPPQVLQDPRYVAFIERFETASPQGSKGGAGRKGSPPPTPEAVRDITHVVINSSFCADNLGFPSSNLLHLRCSQLDDKMFGVPEYSLEPTAPLDALFAPQSEQGGNRAWPVAWKARTRAGFPDMEIPLYPRHRQRNGDPPAPTRHPHGAPMWDFYVGPQTERQTEQDRQKAARLAGFEENEPDAQAGEAAAAAAGTGAPGRGEAGKLSKKEEKKARQAAAAAAAAAAAPGKKGAYGSQNKGTNAGASSSAPPPATEAAPRPSISSSNANSELEEKRRLTKEAKQAAWAKFQTLASAIKEEIQREEKQGLGAEADAPSATQRRRLAVEGAGVVVTPLGTGSASPSKYRTVSSTLVQLPRAPGQSESEPAPCFLLDAGEGTYGQLLRKFGKKGVEDILLGMKLVFLSHAHADHHLGVIRLLIERRKVAHKAKHPLFVIAAHRLLDSLWEHNLCEPLGLAPPVFEERYQRLRVRKFTTCQDVEDLLYDHLREADIRASPLTYLLDSSCLFGDESVLYGDDGDRKWLQALQNHLMSRTLGWLESGAESFVGRNMSGSTLRTVAERAATDEGVKGMYLTEVFKRHPLRLAGAKMVRVLMDELHLDWIHIVEVDHGPRFCFGLVLRRKPLLAPSASGSADSAGSSSTPSTAGPAGFSMAYSGDTRPCDRFVRAAQGVTLMLHEATIEDGREDMADVKGHSTFAQAIDVGRRSGAAATLLTHFSQRYPKLPRLTRRWQGVEVLGPNVKGIGRSRRIDAQEAAPSAAEVVGAQAQGAGDGLNSMMDDDDALLNAMNEAEQTGIIKAAHNGDAQAADVPAAPAPSLPPATANEGMIIATAFDLARYHVPEMWKMERYVPALELLFDADEEEPAEGRSPAQVDFD